ncbi:hypothetical protein AB6A40_011264 [Gnathostoma spinigerum]|uniref:Uncharacterized protein n=1 Tax=Gnathostoma spinigerum TaxID=75299 RepID=A0ABD6F4H1_9BILA
MAPYYCSTLSASDASVCDNSKRGVSLSIQPALYADVPITLFSDERTALLFARDLAEMKTAQVQFAVLFRK